MAPDLNSVPPSPRPTPSTNPPSNQSTPGPLSRQGSATTSRRASQIYPMNPPPLPLATPGGSASASTSASSGIQHHVFPPSSPSASTTTNVDATGVPMRHPRPMTPAEMHLALEKEQEAVVNRLTRELSALRAHSASVASTASSTASGVLLDATDPSAAHAGALAGPTHPTSSRRHRSSSSVSRSGMPPGVHPSRYSVSSQSGGELGHRDAHRSSSVVSTPRYEEVAQQRAELEEVKRENEALKQRIRDLERMIRQGDAEGQRGRRGAPQNGGTGNGDVGSQTQEESQ